MDIETAKLGFQILQFIATGAVGVYVYLTNRDKVTNERITRLEDDLDGKLDTHGERIATLEEAAKHSPSRNELALIHEKINRATESIGELSGEFKGVKTTLNLIHQYLLTGGK